MLRVKLRKGVRIRKHLGRPFKRNLMFVRVPLRFVRFPLKLVLVWLRHDSIF